MGKRFRKHTPLVTARLTGTDRAVHHGSLPAGQISPVSKMGRYIELSEIKAVLTSSWDEDACSAGRIKFNIDGAAGAMNTRQPSYLLQSFVRRWRKLPS